MKRSYQCSACGKEGHQRRTCTLVDRTYVADPAPRRHVLSTACSFCGALGHNRRTCKELEPARERAILMHNELRMRMLSHLVSSGQVPGGMLKLTLLKDENVLALISGIGQLAQVNTILCGRNGRHAPVLSVVCPPGAKTLRNYQDISDGVPVAEANTGFLEELINCSDYVSVFIPGKATVESIIANNPEIASWLNSKKDVDIWFSKGIRRSLDYGRRRSILLHPAKLFAVNRSMNWIARLLEEKKKV